MAFPTGWTRRVAITIDDAQVGSGGVSDFTVLLTRDNLPDEMCSPTDANRAQSDGGDIRFSSDSAGATQLPLCIDNWQYDTTDAAGDADIRMHVLVPSIAGTGSGDTTIYAWYKAGGSETQPSPTDTYGSRNAWDSDHCHRWSLDEATTDTPPEYKDSVATRHLTESGTGSTSVTGKRGNAFDGNGTGYAHGHWDGFVVPLDAGSLPGTNTGLCYIPGDDYLAVVNFDDNEIIEVEKDGTEVTRFAVTEGETAMQGVAYDSVGDQFFHCPDDGKIYVYDRDGTFDRSMTLGYSNALAYDFTDDALWVSNATGSLRQINKSTGATITTITLSGGASGVLVEGIAHNVDDNTLFITTDTGDMVYEINKSTGATIQSWHGPNAIEHIAYDPTDGSIWICSAQRFHLTSGENVVYHYTSDGDSFSWRVPREEYTLEWWWKPDNVTSTAIALSLFAGVTSGAFYIEVQTRSSGIVRVYESDVSFVATASSTIAVGTWYFCQLVYDNSANTLTLYIDTVQKAQATSAVFGAKPDGHFAIGSRAEGSFKHNGAIDEVRLHRVARAAAWRTTRYNNENAPASFASAGTPEAPGGGGATIPIAMYHRLRGMGA